MSPGSWLLGTRELVGGRHTSPTFAGSTMATASAPSPCVFQATRPANSHLAIRRDLCWHSVSHLETLRGSRGLNTVVIRFMHRRSTHLAGGRFPCTLQAGSRCPLRVPGKHSNLPYPKLRGSNAGVTKLNFSGCLMEKSKSGQACCLLCRGHEKAYFK